MLVFGTEMHLVTFIFAVLEVLMFFYQFIYYLSRPEDKSRFWYLMLLFLLIVYNITGGLFPDPHIDISIVTQNIIAYGSGFFMASYFPFYFYKGLELKSLRFHALYGVILFLIAPYLIFFVIDYSTHQNLDFAIKYGIVIPFFYSLVLARAMFKAIQEKYRQDRTKTTFWEMIAVYCAVIPWVSISVVAYFNLGQLIEVIFTNFGLILITFLFISKSVRKARLEYKQLLELQLNGVNPSRFQENCEKYHLTKREIEIVQLIRQGYKYKSIGEKLFIAETTATKHVSNIFEKVKVCNKLELLQKLEK
ncbi:MAG TPA: helix-turn-helix transcriptional regulator [Pedobacter sp.]|jgi:DNA-binding CsgD family transcriptional regulator